MERIAQVARETGYLDGIKDFRSVDIYGHLPPDKVVALCTGSQGEARAALSRIARRSSRVAFSRGDRVIFSSRAIPGNEKLVTRVINGLINQGIEVITDRTHLVHVSGHPRRDELADMLGWVRPRIVVPVHGEALHMAEHGELARRAGVGKVVHAATATSSGWRRAIRDHRRGAFRPALQGRLAADYAANAPSPTAAGSALPGWFRSRSR